jgi:hypothetical protein
MYKVPIQWNGEGQSSKLRDIVPNFIMFGQCTLNYGQTCENANHINLRRQK